MSSETYHEKLQHWQHWWSFSTYPLQWRIYTIDGLNPRQTECKSEFF